MTVAQAFGLVLKQLREKAGISQELLSQECNLDRTYISLLERGLRQPSLSTIITISRHLNIAASSVIDQVEDYLDESQ